eukprot:6484373-Amphidinium_carterae.2
MMQLLCQEGGEWDLQLERSRVFSLSKASKTTRAPPSNHGHMNTNKFTSMYLLLFWSCCHPHHFPSLSSSTTLLQVNNININNFLFRHFRPQPCRFPSQQCLTKFGLNRCAPPCHRVEPQLKLDIFGNLPRGLAIRGIKQQTIRQKRRNLPTTKRRYYYHKTES